MMCFTCPKCQRPPQITFGFQYFCGNDRCDLLMWNPLISAEQNLEQAKHTDIKPHEFRCDHCGKVFDKEWSDEQATEEAQALFGQLDADDRVTVCDPCFEMIKRKAQLAGEWPESADDGR